jgi:hypothetical protein
MGIIKYFRRIFGGAGEEPSRQTGHEKAKTESEYTSNTGSSRSLSRDELANFTQRSVDPTPWGRVTRDGMNANLTDSELTSRIQQRNAEGKPTYLLRLEYQRRLGQREL